MKFRGTSLFRERLFKSVVFKSVLAMGVVLAQALSSVGIAGAGIAGAAGQETRGSVEQADVKNFGKVNDHIYRGAQPGDDDYSHLAAIGIKTIIDLREHPEKYSRRAAEGSGLRYVNIQLNAKRPPTDAESNHFLQLVNDEKNWPVYVHCAGGRHRTGVLLAVYRMEIDGWDARRAYEEMKDFKFYSSFGHGEMKEFVFNYYNRMLAKRATPVAPALKPRQATADGQDN